jgi:hypothetical protein
MGEIFDWQLAILMRIDLRVFLGLYVGLYLLMQIWQSIIAPVPGGFRLHSNVIATRGRRAGHRAVR